MKRRCGMVGVVAVLVLLFVGDVSSAQQPEIVTCAGLGSEAEARAFFEQAQVENPGRRDVYGLDPDADGFPCEGLSQASVPAGAVIGTVEMTTSEEGSMEVRFGALIVFVTLFGLMTLVVGRVLKNHGVVFLEQVFVDREHFAHSVNALLNVGYYLLTLSMLFLNAATVSKVQDEAQAIEVVAMRLGLSVLVIAMIHFINMLIFTTVLGKAERAATEQARLDAVYAQGGLR